MAAIRDEERAILDVFVKKAKVPRKDFINAFAENEANFDWLGQFVANHPSYADALTENAETIKAAQQRLADIEARHGLSIAVLKGICRNISLGEAKARRAKKK